jgi:hypothetical protein
MHVEYCVQYQNCVQWILAHNARVVRVSSRYDEEEMHSRFRCREAFYLVILLCTII